MRYLLSAIFLMAGCNGGLPAHPVSEELWPYAEEWNKACGAEMFTKGGEGASELVWLDTPCEHLAGGIKIGDAGEGDGNVRLYRCAFGATPDRDWMRVTILHELGHVDYISHVSETKVTPDVMSFSSGDRHQQITATDLEQARKVGWPCR